MRSGDPGEWLSFIQSSGFVGDWKRLKLDDEALRELELLLLQRPAAGAAVPGAGGLRKVRFSPSAWRRGKRGAMRVGYVLLLAAGSVLLLAAFGKNEKANFTAAERNALRQAIDRFRKSLGG